MAIDAANRQADVAASTRAEMLRDRYWSALPMLTVTFGKPGIGWADEREVTVHLTNNSQHVELNVRVWFEEGADLFAKPEG
jgi:hypothetical protein